MYGAGRTCLSHCVSFYARPVKEEGYVHIIQSKAYQTRTILSHTVRAHSAKRGLLQGMYKRGLVSSMSIEEGAGY